MTITLSLPQEVEQRLRERARSNGQDVAAFLTQWIEREIAAMPQDVKDQAVENRDATSVAKHSQYLDEISRGPDPLVSPTTSKSASLAWELLREQNPRLPIPASGVGQDGEILYTWNNDDHHLELEVLPGGTAEFFYMNRRTDALSEGRYHVGDGIPQWVVEKLHWFERKG